MKPVIVQKLVKKNKKEFSKVDPTTEDVEKASSKLFNFVVLALTLIVIITISIGA
jgi:hypothetical protein